MREWSRLGSNRRPPACKSILGIAESRQAHVQLTGRAHDLPFLSDFDAGISLGEKSQYRAQMDTPIGGNREAEPLKAGRAAHPLHRQRFNLRICLRDGDLAPDPKPTAP